MLPQMAMSLPKCTSIYLNSSNLFSLACTFHDVIKQFNPKMEQVICYIRFKNTRENKRSEENNNNKNKMFSTHYRFILFVMRTIYTLCPWFERSFCFISFIFFYSLCISNVTIFFLCSSV